MVSTDGGLHTYSLDAAFMDVSYSSGLKKKPLMNLIFERLEQEGVRKGLILDPHLYKQLLDSNSRQEEGEEEEEEKQEVQIKQQFHGFHQNHHQLQQNPQQRLLHGGLAQPLKKRSYLDHAGEEYAPERMGESYQYHNQQIQHQQQQQQASSSSRLGLRSSGGEIVEVQGGHIVRSTGRKDRHSKVCTAKGPRDRRVRLSAHTAIQFYDVQDRLGYDRPSKAVDWLIKKAKTAIDELAELPAWKPTATAVTRTTTNPNPISNFEQNPDQLNHFEQHPDDNIVDNQMGNSQNSSFLPPSLDSDSIADTIKSFFPMGASSNPPNDNTSTGMQFHQTFPPPDLLSRASNRSQDLRLSLQSFQDPILHHQQPEQGDNNNIYFDGSGWPEAQPGGFQRMVAWGGDAVSNSTGFVFGSQPTTPFLQPLFGQTTNNQLFNNNSQRGPLQSSTAPSFRAWIDPPPPPFAGVAVDQHPTLAFHHPSSIAGFASGSNTTASPTGRRPHPPTLTIDSLPSSLKQENLKQYCNFKSK
ncbi:hypothetical protein L1987_49516 [Smallanthus sonchifolius]|uniref:Uncharacterized protein n=1 Tax=Smallanthus sonchifolius TaxID=185202 RepID=A0ACB9FVH9_9ASTR|nr:hypothetical protein L1987_49516 [Smallanthus sonchifolius]